MPRIKDQSVCIRQLDWSETSQVVVLLTQEHGKIRGLAKGSKRTSPSSVQRFSGGIELLTLGQIVATTRQTTELVTLTEWDLQNDFLHLRQSLEAHRLAMLSADLTHAMLADRDPHPATFAALAAMLAELAEPAARPAALLRFQWTLLVDCGYQPELEQDVATTGPLSDADTFGFDPTAGGFTEQCAGHAWRVRRQTVHILRSLAVGEPVDGENDSIGRANRLLCAYARAILDRELPTMHYVLQPYCAAAAPGTPPNA